MIIACTKWIAQTAVGDAAQTIEALNQGKGGPQPWISQEPLLTQVHHLFTELCPSPRVKRIIVATTKGDCVDWSKGITSPKPSLQGGPAHVAHSLARLTGIPCQVVSAACASGPAALGEAARLIQDGFGPIAVIGCDRLAPLVAEGFASLGAVDPNGCRPFDENRAGLTLGEALAGVLLEARSEWDGPRLTGWGCTQDANHLTGPSRDGKGLAQACAQAIQPGLEPQLTIGHGTGTRYNDDSESLAYAAVAPQAPVVGWKGLTGHTLGTCGILETALLCQALQQGAIPGTFGHLHQGTAGDVTILQPGANSFVPEHTLNANAGFGGVNAAVVISTSGRHRHREQARGQVICAFKALASSEGRQLKQPEQRFIPWAKPDPHGGLPAPGAREIMGKVDASWGRMDPPSRILCALLALYDAPIPPGTAILLLTDNGCYSTDRPFEHDRLEGRINPQRFPYTLPSTALGEASIRFRLTGPGMVMMAVSDDEGRQAAGRLLREGAPLVLCARVEIGPQQSLAWVEAWETAA